MDDAVTYEQVDDAVDAAQPENLINEPVPENEPAMESPASVMEAPTTSSSSLNTGDITMIEVNPTAPLEDAKPDLSPGICEIYGKLNDASLEINHETRSVILRCQFERGTIMLETKEQLACAWILGHILTPIMTDAERHG